jgi:hypothetical protein
MTNTFIYCSQKIMTLMTDLITFNYMVITDIERFYVLYLQVTAKKHS